MKPLHRPVCQSEKIIPDVVIREEQGFKVQIIIPRKPQAVLLKDNYTSKVYATVCGNCGHCSLAIRDPEAAWQAYTMSQTND